jgi:DNA-binding transcriptional LysR family regulator
MEWSCSLAPSLGIIAAISGGTSFMLPTMMLAWWLRSAHAPLRQAPLCIGSRARRRAFVGFDEDLPIQAHIDRYFREHRLVIDPTLRFDNLQMIKEAVAHGAGISVMPRRVMTEDITQGRLRAIALDPPELHRPVGIIHRRRKSFNEATRSLLSLLQEEQSNIAA